MPDREKVIKGLQELHGSQETMELISDAIALLKEQNRLIAEARNEGYNEAYRSYCVEVAKEDQECLRYAVEQDLEDAGFDVDVALLKEQEAKNGVEQK